MLSTISRRGRVLRAPPRKIYRRSAKQKIRRSAFRATLTAKTKAWSLGYRSLWTVYAANHPHTGTPRHNTRATADNWFMRINIIRMAGGLEPILKPPND